jgi:glutaredoxin
MSKVVLYSTEGCHLCELALALLHQLKTPIEITIIEIGDDERLVEKYGTSIPVVEFANGQQLNWPFTLEELNNTL